MGRRLSTPPPESSPSPPRARPATHARARASAVDHVEIERGVEVQRRDVGIGAPAAFVVYGLVNATTAAPLSGPTEGDTLVTFGGSGFGNGSDYRCRFGAGLEVDGLPG